MRATYLSCSLIVSFCLLLGPTLYAQGKTANADLYAGESFVIDRSDWVYSENADGTGYREHTVAVTIQSEAAVRTFGVIGVGFAGASEHVEIHYARVRHKDGSVTETPASGALEQPEQVTREAPFYSDLKQMQLPVKSLQAGDTLEWQARIVRTRAEAPNQFWGSESFVSDDAVTLEEAIELRVPAASATTVWTNPQLATKAVESVDGVTKVYRWQSAQLNATTGPAAEAAKKAKKGKLLTPDKELDAEEGVLPSVAWTTFKNWEAVGAWYRGLEGQRAVPDDEIKAKVAELTAGKTGEEDKVKAVYAYVSAQIRYIGVAFGIGRFQPHEAVDVLHNQYGDCKDKATLLASMLAVLGLHADSVLIGEGVRWNEAVPSPAAFNHLITRVPVGGREVWLDATQEVAPYEVLLFDLRDKPALVIPDASAATVMRTPKDLPFPGVDSWEAVGSIDKAGTAESHITMTLRGDDELVFRAVAHQVAPAQYDQLIQKIVANFGYGGTVSHADLDRPEETSGPYVLRFDYHREKAGDDWEHLRTVPQLLPVQLPVPDEKDPPVQALLLGTPHTELSKSELKLPAGWRVELPEAIHESTPWVTYDLTYRFDKGTLYSTRKLVILQRKVPASEWKIYKKWTDAVSPGSEPYIQLTRGSAEKADITPAPDASKDSDSKGSASTLIEKAGEAMQRMDADGAESLLKRAEALDPKALKLWAAYCAVELLRGAPNQAIEYCHKEQALHPDEREVYPILMSAQAMNHDESAATETLQRWTAADPENPQPEITLARLMLARKKYPEAVAAAEKGLALLGTEDAARDEQLQMTLGMAQMKAGLTDRGEVTLAKLLRATEDPDRTNDAAYELADAGRELPLDEKRVSELLERLNTETRSWTLDEAPEVLRARTSLLAATWDTMGWILFRQSKFSEARSYIAAAAENHPSSEVQDHLDAVNQAQKLKPAKVTPGSQEARTFELGGSNGRFGLAEYRLLIEQGKVQRVEPAGGKTINGAEEMLRHCDFSKLFPAGVDAALVRHGMVNCFAGKCVLVLEP